MATAADCATLRIPRYERPLCPTARQRAYGIDWLDHDAASPLKSYVAPAGENRFAVIASFDRQVLVQQPQRVIAAVAARRHEAVRAGQEPPARAGRRSRAGSSRTFYPTYGDWVMLGRQQRRRARPAPAAGQRDDHPARARPLVRRPGGRQQAARRVPALLPAGRRLYSRSADGRCSRWPGWPASLLALARRPTWPRRTLSPGVRWRSSRPASPSWPCPTRSSSPGAISCPALVTLPPAGVLGLTIARKLPVLALARRRRRAACRRSRAGQPGRVNAGRATDPVRA